MQRRRFGGAGLLVAVGVGIALRLPWTVSRAVIGYDDGAYLASVQAMRAGQLPFRDVFSSQGPVFLPLLYVADLVGLRAPWAARLAPLAAGAALVVLAHRLALVVADRAHALVAALLVATSGCLLLSTMRVESDAIAAAFATGAVLVVATERRGSWALAGLAVATKSLLVAPALLAVTVLLVRRRGWLATVRTGACALAVVVVLALPWGVGRVWEQSIGLHLDATGDRTPGANLAVVRDELLTRDRLLIVALAIALATALLRRRVGRADVDVALWVWLLGAVALLALHTPLNEQHLTVLVVPAALLVARLRPPVIAVAAAGVLLLPSHGAGAEWRVTSPESTPSERAAVDVLRRVEPAGSRVITDEPTLSWLAGRVAPGDLVDPSFVRIDAGGLTLDDLAAAAADPRTCAVVFWSGRLDTLPGARSALDGYRHVERALERDGAELWLRGGCTLRRADSSG